MKAEEKMKKGVVKGRRGEEEKGEWRGGCEEDVDGNKTKKIKGGKNTRKGGEVEREDS
jgi:hypothetical protein